MALLMCYGSPCCYDSGLQLVCTVGSGVSHLPLDNTHIFSIGSGQASLPTNQVILWSLNQVLLLLTVWAGAKSCWKMKSASP